MKHAKLYEQFINEAVNDTVYVVVEDGDSNQYMLDNMKVFTNEKEANKYADSQRYGGFTVIKVEVEK